eukprot:2277836-Amphidinium_carterae.1
MERAIAASVAVRPQWSAVDVLFYLLVVGSVLPVWRIAMLWLLRHVRATRLAVMKDVSDVYRAFLFLGCELLFVLARRSPIGRLALRRTALRWRPYVATEISGSPLYVESPDVTSDGSPLVRRSLARIQLEYQVVQGGQFVHHSYKSVVPGRWCSRRRIQAPRPRRWHTVYNPSEPGECLLAVLCKYAGGDWNVKKLRRAIQLHAANLLVTADPVLCGHSLATHLHANYLDPTKFLQDLVSHRRRWGNSLDVLIASNMLSTRFVVYDIKQRKVICDPGCYGAPKMIGYAEHHFTAGFLDKNQRLKPSPSCGLQGAARALVGTLAAIVGSALILNHIDVGLASLVTGGQCHHGRVPQC